MPRRPSLVFAAHCILRVLESPRSTFRLSHSPQCRSVRRPTMANAREEKCSCGLHRFHLAVQRFHIAQGRAQISAVEKSRRAVIIHSVRSST